MERKWKIKTRGRGLSPVRCNRAYNKGICVGNLWQSCTLWLISHIFTTWFNRRQFSALRGLFAVDGMLDGCPLYSHPPVITPPTPIPSFFFFFFLTEHMQNTLLMYLITTLKCRKCRSIIIYVIQVGNVPPDEASKHELVWATAEFWQCAGIAVVHYCGT